MKQYLMLIAITMAVIASSCKNDYKNQGLINDTRIQPEQESAANEKGIFRGASATDSLSGGEKSIPGQLLNLGNPGTTIDWDKKIIKTADLLIELSDFKNFNSKLHRSVAAFGGYVAGEEQNQKEDRVTSTVVIKVPVDRFEDMVSLLSSGEVKLVTKKITADDVTGDIIDTKSRIEAKRQIRSRYLELLQQAKNMNEILQVQTEINSVQEGLESAGGRVNYLLHQSAFSTVNLTFYQYFKTPEETIEPTFVSKLAGALSNGGVIISGFILTIAAIWPLLIAAFIIWYLIRKRKLSPSAFRNN